MSSTRLCHRCHEIGLPYCCYYAGERPEDLVCFYDLGNKFMSPKVECGDKKVAILERPDNIYQNYHNLEGRKQYHVSRKTSFTFLIRLYIDGVELNHISESWVTYDETIEALHDAGFTEGFYENEIARQKKDAEQAIQRHEYMFENKISIKGE